MLALKKAFASQIPQPPGVLGSLRNSQSHGCLQVQARRVQANNSRVYPHLLLRKEENAMALYAATHQLASAKFPATATAASSQKP